MKKTTYCLLLFLLTLFKTYSQVQVGDGKVTDQIYSPFSASVDYSYNQTIYLASEINASGTITSIKWYYAGTGGLFNNDDLTIYLGTTAKTKFNSINDWVPFSKLTEVYHGAITTNKTPGWKTITLDTPYVYNGNSNLVVAVDENSAGRESTVNPFYNTPVTDSRTIFLTSLYAESNPDPVSPLAGYIMNYIPSIIFGGINQPCSTPHNITATDITSSGANISWDTPTSTPSNGSEYFISDTNTPPIASTVATGTINSGNSFSINSLIPSKLYYIWVRNKCGSVYSNWSETAIFSTICGPLTSIYETFDSVTVPNLPNCWTKIIRGSSLNSSVNIVTSNSSSEQIFSSPNVVKMFNSTASTASNDIILVSPDVSTTINLKKYRLKFYIKSSRINDIIQIGTLNSNTNDALFTPLLNYETINITNSTTEIIVNFDQYTGNDTFIGIKMKTSNNYTYNYIDQIRWEKIPVCFDVDQIKIPLIGAKAIEVTWKSGGDEKSWDIATSTIDTNPEYLPFVNFPSKTAVINDLTGNTTYKLWIRSSCSDNDKGAWIGPVTFTTDCEEIDALFENFDGVSPKDLPFCWSKIISGPSIEPKFTRIETTSTAAGAIGSSPNSVDMFNSSSDVDTSNIILISPRLSTLKSGTYRLRFKAKQNVIINPAAIMVGTMKSTTSAEYFEPYQRVNLTETSQDYIIDFSAITGTDNTHIAFKLASKDTNIHIYIDDVVWEPAPYCPDVYEIKIPTSTPKSATITWSNLGNENNWQVVYGPMSTVNPYSITPVDSTEKSKLISNLQSNTQYKVWVRSVCDNEQYGAFIGPVVFTTPCEAIESFSESVDNSNIVTPNLPGCWSKLNRGVTASASSEIKTFITSNSYTAPSCFSLNNAVYEGTSDVILVSPNLSTINDGSYILEFYAKGSPGGNPAKLQIGTLSSNTVDGTFTPIKSFDLTTTYALYTLNFESKESLDQFIGFRVNSVNNSTIYLDNVRFYSNKCGEAKKVAVLSTTPNSATVSWENGNANTAWDIVVGNLSDNEPTLLTYVNTTDNPYMITKLSDNASLTPNTSYNFWIKSHCNEDKSDWAGPFTFTTACEAVDTLEEYFDTVSTPNLPSCWTKVLRGTTLAPAASIKAKLGENYSGKNSVEFRNVTSLVSDDIILVSPNLSQLAGNQLHFYAKGEGVVIQVGTLSSNTPSATFTLLNSFSLSASYSERIVDFSEYTGADSYIGFRMRAQQTYSVLNLDNVTFGQPDSEDPLSTSEFDLDNFKFYPNPVKDILNIKSGNNIDSVSVYNILGQEILVKPIDGNWTKIDMSDLSNGNYLVKIISNDQLKTIKIIKQ